jgi:hypothetical protein
VCRAGAWGSNELELGPRGAYRARECVLRVQRVQLLTATAGMEEQGYGAGVCRM